MVTHTLEIPNGYSKSRVILKFRHPYDTDELVCHCNANEHIWFLSLDGTARRAKVNGRVRTWKRTPSRVEIPVKYGLYEYGTFTAEDIKRVLIPV